MGSHISKDRAVAQGMSSNDADVMALNEEADDRYDEPHHMKTV